MLPPLPEVLGVGRRGVVGSTMMGAGGAARIPCGCCCCEGSATAAGAIHFRLGCGAGSSGVKGTTAPCAAVGVAT